MVQCEEMLDAFAVGERIPALLRALILAELGGEPDESLGGKPGGAGQAGASRRRPIWLRRVTRRAG